ncbi:MAG: AAA family ATPase [Pseudomonadota bacterium]|mgnify:CR=1 FL=1
MTNIQPDQVSEDAGSFYFTAAHWEAQDAIIQAISDGDGLSALIGPTGSGKSVLARQIAAELPSDHMKITLAVPPGSAQELVSALHGALGAETAAREAKSVSDAVRLRLHQLVEADQKVVLFVDDADRCPEDVVELIARMRRIGETQSGDPIGVQSVLIGGPTLRQMFDDASSSIVAEALGVRAHLRYLTSEEIRRFLAQRFDYLNAIAAPGQALIDVDAIDRIEDLTVGAPRLLSLLSNHIALFTKDASALPITIDMVDEAADATSMYLKRTVAIAEAEMLADLPTVLPETRAQTPLDALAPLAPTAEAAPSDDPKAGEVAPPWRNRPTPDNQAQKGPRVVRTVRRRGPITLSRKAYVIAAGVAAIAVTGIVAPMVAPAALRAWEQHKAAAEDSSVDVGGMLDETGRRVKDGAVETFEKASLAFEDAQVVAGSTYEDNRGELLDVVDGVLNSAEDVARSFADDAETPQIVRDAASAVASNLNEKRATLEVGQAIEAARARGDQSVSDALRSQVDAYLKTARQRFEAEQFTAPIGDSAYDAYLAALRLQGANAQALLGLQSIENIYRQQASNALRRRKYEEFHQLSELADKVRARQPL